MTTKAEAVETNSNVAGDYYATNPGANEGNWPNKLAVPDEIKPSPMTPYFMSTRPQQASFMGYDGKAHAPLGWICRQSPIVNPITDIKIDIPTIGPGKTRNQSFWGKTIRSKFNDDGINVILFPIPRRPLLSLWGISFKFARTLELIRGLHGLTYRLSKL